MRWRWPSARWACAATPLGAFSLRHDITAAPTLWHMPRMVRHVGTALGFAGGGDPGRDAAGVPEADSSSTVDSLASREKSCPLAHTMQPMVQIARGRGPFSGSGNLLRLLPRFRLNKRGGKKKDGAPTEDPSSAERWQDW